MTQHQTIARCWPQVASSHPEFDRQIQQPRKHQATDNGVRVAAVLQQVAQLVPAAKAPGEIQIGKVAANGGDGDEQ